MRTAWSLVPFLVSVELLYSLALSKRSITFVCFTPLGGQQIKRNNEALLNRVLSLLPANLTVQQHSWVKKMQCMLAHIFVLRTLTSEKNQCHTGTLLNIETMYFD